MLHKYYNFLYKKKLYKGFPFPVKVKGRYFISTDIGIFYLSSNQCRLVTSYSGYGIALSNSNVYLSFESNLGKKKGSRIISASKNDLIDGVLFNKSKLKKSCNLYIQPFLSNNGRIHQITYTSYSGGELLVAATEENSIVKINLKKNKRCRIYPFLDKFSEPIKNFDHNHINSVIRIGGVIYFVAYKTGNSSFIGFLYDGSVYGCHVYPKGYHDFFPTSTGFITCDTFGNHEYGRVLTENGIMNEIFSKKSFAPRGVAGDNKELIVGHSHKGPRKERFKGNGGLIIFKKNKFPQYVQLPSSQVYSIVKEDGYTAPPEICSHEKMKNKLISQFGSICKIGNYLEENI